MEGSAIQTYLGDVLHAISQGLLIPTIALLIALIGYAAFCIGSILAEYFTERKHFKVTMPKFLSDLMGAKQDEIPEVIQNSGLLNRQKIALLTVYDYRTLPGDAMVALIRRLVSEEEGRYDRIATRNNMAARVSPMIGLMGTLIPLGPGIQALGRQDTTALSNSLLIAFDTTVAGLVVAAVCIVIGKIRQTWYGDYMTALDSGMATLLEKIETMRANGLITIEEPTDYAFLFEKSLEKEKPAAKQMAQTAEEVKAEAENGNMANEVAAAEAAELGVADAGVAGTQAGEAGEAVADGDAAAGAAGAAGVLGAAGAAGAAASSSSSAKPFGFSQFAKSTDTAKADASASTHTATDSGAGLFGSAGASSSSAAREADATAALDSLGSTSSRIGRDSATAADATAPIAADAKAATPAASAVAAVAAATQAAEPAQAATSQADDAAAEPAQEKADNAFNLASSFFASRATKAVRPSADTDGAEASNADSASTTPTE